MFRYRAIATDSDIHAMAANEVVAVTAAVGRYRKRQTVLEQVEETAGWTRYWLARAKLGATGDYLR